MSIRVTGGAFALGLRLAQKKARPSGRACESPLVAREIRFYFRTSVLLLLDVLVLPESVALLLLVVPVPEAVPDAEPETEPDALTPTLLLVSDGVVVAELEVLRSVDVLLLVELVAAESEVVSVPEVLVFVSTEQPVTPSARAINAELAIRVHLLRFMVCLPKVGVE